MSYSKYIVLTHLQYYIFCLTNYSKYFQQYVLNMLWIIGISNAAIKWSKCRTFFTECWIYASWQQWRSIYAITFAKRYPKFLWCYFAVFLLHVLTKLALTLQCRDFYRKHKTLIVRVYPASRNHPLSLVCYWLL